MPRVPVIPTEQVEIKKRSKMPGVMITQYVKELPRGKNTPDFNRKPMALSVQEGKVAIFRAVVCGDPAPTVTWARIKGDTSDPELYKTRFDQRSREYILEIPNVKADQADTYKCFATNEFGKAVCTATLGVTSAGFKKPQADGQTNDPEDFRKMLKKTTIVKKRKEKPKKEGEIDPKFWEVMLSAKKSNYERICQQFGVTDYRWMLKQLNLKKKEREDEQAKVVEKVDNMKQMEVKTSGRAEFEFEMKLTDPNSKLYVYKNGDMLDFGDGTDDSCKHNMKKSDDKYLFSINNPTLNDSGLYQVDVEDVNIFSTNFTIPDVEFNGMLKDAKAVEGHDAVFECVLSGPVPQITWCANDISVEHGDKYNITVSEDKLTHRLEVNNCKPEDRGVYTAIAGIKSSRATLAINEDPNARRKGRGCASDNADEVGRKAKGADGRGDGEDGSEGSGFEDGHGGDARGKHGLIGVDTDNDGSGQHETGVKLGSAVIGSGDDDKVNFANGLSDINTLRGKSAELVCTLNTDNADGVWYKNGVKLTSKDGVTILKDGCTHKLIIQSCNDADEGLYEFEVNGCRTQAMVKVGDLPEFNPDALQKFSNPVIVKAGQGASFKMPFQPQDSLEIKWFNKGSELNDGGSVKVIKESNLSRLQIKDCLRSDTGEIKIQLKNPFGSIEAVSSLIVLDKPGPPQGPLEVNGSTSSVLELKWNPPKDDGGSEVTNYIIERQQVGQNTWEKIGDISANHLTFRDRNVSRGKRYIYRIYAENLEGISEPMETEKIMAGALVFPGPPAPPKVISASKNCINLTWSPPENDGGTQILGYQLEKRKKDTNQWVNLNPVNEPIQGLKYAVRDVSEGSEYEFRLSAINRSGAGEPSAPSVMACAKNPNMKPYFKDPEDLMVVRSGNSIRIKINYEASPQPVIRWLKNGEPVSPLNQIFNTDGTSTLVIPSSKYSDSGVYTIVAKNSSGQTSFDIEVRVADEPKPPGPVELEQVVYGKVIISWAPSPDQKKDDRLHYMVAEYNSNTRIWRRIADHLFCATYTTNIQPGQEYHFRIYAKNDLGLSDPSDSPTWGINSNRVSVTSNVSAVITLERPPSILVPLKLHSPPKGYQCFMTCAVRGYPTPNIGWYHNGICIDSNHNYNITNAFGICSMYILRVGHEDGGEYKVVAVNPLGRAECSTVLKVKD
ncbi:immunoglobulin-like and fibronectin type III domain-containing protein 1 isoform X1 [Paramisgurnus dabryanus]|uniref:immunoglobulin-like and fibronectin type III domain-containing protein 1 isoform X1 n=1 Tax=Paramisgurnus dabryanus TaxID=90735 RepID=UPI003CCFA6EF